MIKINHKNHDLNHWI